jgi:pentatricopeptide repeat protein
MNEARRGIGREGARSPQSPHDVPTPARSNRGDRGARGSASALEDLMRRRGVDEAWSALEEMQQHGTTTDKYTVSRMLMKTVGDGRSRLNPARVYRGISLVEKFIEMQPTDVDEVLLNALLDTCCRLKDLNRLESIMQRMRDLNLTPSPVTLGILVKTYGQAGNIEKVLQVWGEMEKQRGQANAVTYGCMIDACVKCNHLDKAVEIFQGMRVTGKHRNTILYTTLIKGYGLDKDLKSALELFREMPGEGVPYNTITYNSIIDACVKCGHLANAEQLLYELTSPSSPLEPDLISFSTLLKGYCHVGDLDKALKICEDIKAKGLRCDELVYNTLMDGCVKANDVTAGVGLFEEMVHNGIRPSAITHSILARLYQRAGYEDDASEAVAQLYQHHGLERPTGGDRFKGAGRRGANQRSPHGRGGPSPTASPLSGYGIQRNDSCWITWSDAHSASGYDAFTDPSAASTPCGSPGHSVGNANGLFLPLEAMRGVPPPLPGMGGSDTPYASLTPMNSAFTGSYASSPCMTPGMEQQQGLPSVGAVMAIPASPAQLPPYSTAPPVAAQALPPWPFASGTAPAAALGGCTVPGPQGAMPGVEANGHQYFSVQMPQPPPLPAPAMTHPMGNMMSVPCQSPMNGSTNQDNMLCPPQMQARSAAGPGAASVSWNNEPAEAQQSPFPMPLSPPHDLAHNICTTSQPQQAYFETFAPNGRQVVNVSGSGGGSQSPFGL